MDTVHECDRQTDGQTDGRTDRITITDTVQTASHGKNQTIYSSYWSEQTTSNPVIMPFWVMGHSGAEKAGADEYKLKWLAVMGG